MKQNMTQAVVSDSIQNFPPGCQTQCSEAENEIRRLFVNFTT